MGDEVVDANGALRWQASARCRSVFEVKREVRVCRLGSRHHGWVFAVTVWEATGWSLVRAVGVGLVATLLVPVVISLVRRWRWMTLAVVMPAMLPGLWLGYAYRPEGLDWVIERWKADLLHGAISIGRILSWATVVAYVVGVRVAGRRELTWKQTRLARSSWQQWVGRGWLWVDRSRGALAGGLVAALWTFGEAEVAALLQARGWTEWTFRKLAGGWETGSIATSLWPAGALTLACVAGVYGLAVRRQSSGSDGQEHAAADLIHRWAKIVAAVTLAALFLVNVVVPAGRLATEALKGLGTLGSQSTAAAECGHTLLAAIIASSVAWFFGRQIETPSRGRWLVIVLACFGAFGSLLMAVIVKSLAYDLVADSTAAQLLVQYAALAFVLLPGAVLLNVATRSIVESRQSLTDRLLHQHGNAAVRHAARERLWKQAVAPRVAAWGLLFWTAFWDLQTAVMLAPPGWETSPGRLYNLAHYGQNQSLAAMLLVLSAAAFAIPVAVLFLSRFRNTR